MSEPSREPTSQSELIAIYKSFLDASLDRAVFYGGLLVLGTSKNSENSWLTGDHRTRFFKVGFETNFIYSIAVFDSLLNSLTSFVLCHRPGSAIGDKDVKAGRLISTPRAQIISEYVDARVKQLSRESFVFRIKELERILKVDLEIEADEYDDLKTAARVRNKIIHEGSSFEFKIDKNMCVIRKESQSERISSNDWAYFDFIEPLASRIYLKIAETLFGSDVTEFIKSLHDKQFDTFRRRKSEEDALHDFYDKMILRAEFNEVDEPPSEDGN